MAEVFVYLGLWFVFLLALAHAVLFVCEYCEFVCELILPELKVDSNRENLCLLLSGNWEHLPTWEPL